MSIGYVRALRILHRAFGHYPAGHRLHMLVRFFTCPFTRTIDDVPAGARVLDIGAGHGLYARLITEERAREVVAVDPDQRKSFLPSPSPKIRKVAAYDDAIRGSFDTVVMFDTAYRMSLDVQRAVFERAFARLRPGGTFILKEMDATSFKMRWARFQEWLSDTFLHLTIGSGFFCQSPDELRAMLTAIGFTDFQARAVDRGYLHPHMLFTARRPQ
jgi:cyclopropane fatty-acyl-phospholipid synthase-like methyltransferase